MRSGSHRVATRKSWSEAAAYADQRQPTPDCKPIAFSGPKVRPAVKDNAVLQRWECRVTGLNPQVRMQLQPAFDISVEGGPGFGHVLKDIEVEVREILNAPEIVTAVA